MITTEHILEMWEAADATLRANKALEGRLRDMLCERLLADEKPDASGLFNFYLNDREVAINIALGITVDEAEYNIHKDALTDAEKAAIQFRPVVNKTELNKLPKGGTLRRECIIVKPGKPTVKIVS